MILKEASIKEQGFSGQEALILPEITLLYNVKFPSTLEQKDKNSGRG